MKLHPRNDLLIVEKIAEEEKSKSGIILPGDNTDLILIKVKVLAVGPKVEDMHIGDIVYAENIVQPLYKNNNKIGLLNQKYIHCIENNGRSEIN